VRELLIEFDGAEYRCRASYDVIMHVEDRVTLATLASRVAAGAQTGDVPMSHVAWVYYCLLHGAGAPVAMQDVMDAVAEDKTTGESIQAVLAFILAEVFGTGPAETVQGVEEPDEAAVKKP
jgi:hypothetical protein